MNSTNVGILNLLYQGSFHPKDLSTYLEIDSKTLVKNISQLNRELEDLELNEIQLVEGKYQLCLEKNQWNFILNSKEFMSSDDIIDYLYLKFIYNGFINLESEKNHFQISRSSINRYFLVVKNILGKNKSTYRYENGKGLRLIELSTLDKNLFCKKLIKVFVKCEFTVTPTTVYHTLFKNSKIEGFLKKIYDIFLIVDVPATKFMIAFSFALKICVDTFGGFENIAKKYNHLEEYREVEDKIYLILKDYPEKYKVQIFSFLLNLKNNESFFEKETVERAKILMKELKERLKIEYIEEGFEELLMKKLYMSLFKYENNILKVYSSKLNNDDKRLLKIVEESLVKTSLRIYFYDKMVLLNILKKIIIENNKKNINKILLLFNEIILPNDLYLKENLKKQIPHVSIDIMPSFHLRFNYLNCINSYDLILSDEKYQDENVEKLTTFSYLKVLEKIDKKAMENGLKNIIQYN